MNTKEQILNISLELFAQKGYAGVSVRDIAGAVGVRESALYKHYKNKQDIFDHIMLVMKARTKELFIEYKVPEAITDHVSDAYQSLTSEQLCDISWKLFLLYTKDPMMSNYRKLLMREQFSNGEAAKRFDQYFLSGVVRREGETFSKLVESGMFRDEKPETIALQFYGPILLLFQMYDCNPESEEQIKEMLFDHVITFGKNFTRKNNEN